MFAGSALVAQFDQIIVAVRDDASVAVSDAPLFRSDGSVARGSRVSMRDQRRGRARARQGSCVMNDRHEWARVLAMGAPRRHRFGSLFMPPAGAWMQPNGLAIDRADMHVVYRGPGIVHAADKRRKDSDPLRSGRRVEVLNVESMRLSDQDREAPQHAAIRRDDEVHVARVEDREDGLALDLVGLADAGFVRIPVVAVAQAIDAARSDIATGVVVRELPDRHEHLFGLLRRLGMREEKLRHCRSM
jgi:hypothetical protein